MRKKLFLSSAGALLVVIILTTAVAMDAQWLNNLDNLFIQHRIPDISYLTVFAGAAAKFATIGPMLVIFSVLAIFLLRINYKGLAAWGLGNLFLISGVGYLLKQLLQRTRPAQVQYIARSSYSFPSGHSLLIMTFICSLFLIYFFREKKLPIYLKLVLILLGITIAGGRLYLGVHYFSDILTGLFLGVGLTFGTAGLFYPYLQQSSPRLTRTRKSAFSTWQKV